MLSTQHQKLRKSRSSIMATGLAITILALSASAASARRAVTIDGKAYEGCTRLLGLEGVRSPKTGKCLSIAKFRAELGGKPYRADQCSPSCPYNRNLEDCDCGYEARRKSAR